MLREAVPFLLAEASGRPPDPWPMYRLAWTYNRLGVPDSALPWAEFALELDPGNQWYMCEVLRSLCSMEMFAEAAGYLPRVRGGGVCRYYLARAESGCGAGDSPSRTWLEDALGSEDDSTAADAACWLSLLLAGRVPEDSLSALLASAVELDPGNEFYRCRYAGVLAGEGRTEEAAECLRPLRVSGVSSQAYWQARAELARAEGDDRREIWALRRAWQARRTPDAAESLGWALYLYGRDAMRSGDLALADGRLREASSMGDTGDAYTVLADSLLELIEEYTRQTGDCGR
jgi:tetratricopeptide (TPR) repeat protein